MSAHRRCLALYLLLVSGLLPASMAGSAPVPRSESEINQRVIAALPEKEGQKAHVIAHVDLTGPFGTRTPWTFVAATLPGTHEDGVSDGPAEGGALATCLVHGLTPQCTYGTPRSMTEWFGTALDLYSAGVVYRGENKSQPLLMVRRGGPYGGDGSHAIYTELFAYDRQSDKFTSVFSNITGSNNNQRTRFVEDEPIRGYVIVNEPTGCCYYRVEVFRQGPSGLYIPIFHYQSHTLYGDGNPLSVSDSEMPEILRRLGLWHPGDALPMPRDYEGCKPVLRRGELWCK